MIYLTFTEEGVETVSVMSGKSETSTAPTRRERVRAATIEEIKATALRLMHEQGSADLRFSDIAREMGMTAPALYRYFSDRDELLSALIADAYNDLADAVEAARAGVPADDPTGRWYAVSQAFRSWANQEPQQFGLIFGAPVPGFVTPQEGPVAEACTRAITGLKAFFVEAHEQGKLGPPLIRDVDKTLVGHFEEKKEGMHDPGLPPETFQALLNCWASLYGFTSLEAYGHLHFLSDEARDALFASGMRLAAIYSGLPAD
jgi:AcrR family transcriptional regulator